MPCASRTVASICGGGGGSGCWPAAGCGRYWPRHCFSSHSTQKGRPCDTGNRQAWHFCRFLSTGGTAIDSDTASGRTAAGWVCTAADQKSGFFGRGCGLVSSGFVFASSAFFGSVFSGSVFPSSCGGSSFTDGVGAAAGIASVRSATITLLGDATGAVSGAATSTGG